MSSVEVPDSEILLVREATTMYRERAPEEKALETCEPERVATHAPPSHRIVPFYQVDAVEFPPQLICDNAGYKAA